MNTSTGSPLLLPTGIIPGRQHDPVDLTYLRALLVPRPQTIAALRASGDASGCVLALEARGVQLRPES